MAVLYEWDPGTSSFRVRNAVIGDDGGKTAFLHILGYYDTLELLQAAVPNPKAGDCYGIGVSAPYNFHVFDGVTQQWKDNGTLKGIQGVGITTIERTSGNGSPGTTDTYTITLSDGESATFTVTNGADGVYITSIARTSGNGAAGTTDTYTITLSNEQTATFQVYNGADGTVDTSTIVMKSSVGVANGVASLDGDAKVTAAQASAAIVAVSASINIGSSHHGRMLYCSNTTAITITVSTGVPVGTEIEVYRAATGTVTLSASGVTFQCKSATYGIADQYTSVILKWVATDTVAIQGNVG